jgi:hypothetical protein
MTAEKWMLFRQLKLPEQHPFFHPAGMSSIEPEECTDRGQCSPSLPRRHLHQIKFVA